MTNSLQLDRADRQLLVGFGSVILLLATITNPAVSFDGVILVQSIREMTQPTGDWLIPSAGGRPLLDQTPVLQWLVGFFASYCGEGTVLTATRVLCACGLIALSVLSAENAALVFGRRAGLLTGLTTMTTVSLVQSVGEARSDIFSAVMLMLVTFAFLRAEVAQTHSEPMRMRLPRSLFTSRRRETLQLFACIALAALICPPSVLFVSLLIPAATFLISGRLQSALREYLWLWGIVGVLMSAMAWPLIVCSQVSDAWEVWLDTDTLWNWLAGFGAARMQARCSHGAALIFTLSISWGLLAPVGMWFTRHEALGSKRSLERVLWIQALIAPLAAIVLLDQPRAALMASVGAWNMLAAVGIERWIDASVQRMRNWLANARVYLPALSFPVSRISIAAAFLIFVGVFVPTLWTDSIGIQTARTEAAFIRDVITRMPGTERIAVDLELGDDGIQALFDLQQRGKPLHNLSYVLDESEPDRQLVLTRRRGLRALLLVGAVDELASCESSTATSDDELTLFRLKVAPGMARTMGSSRTPSLAQRLHKEPGPWVNGWQLSSRADISVGREPATMIAVDPRAEGTRPY